jgi:diguanylate cyclase (GGDEF)-like protein
MAESQSDVLGARGAAGGARHISGSTTWNIVNLVRKNAGEDGVDRLLRLAGETRTAAELEDDAGWSSFWQGKSLFEAASVVLNDPHAPRLVGESIARADMTSEVSALLRSLESPGELLRSIELVAPKFCTVVKMQALEIGADHALIGATSVEGYPRYQLLCDFTAGLLSQAPLPFDLPPATVTEEQCELRGDPGCVFRVRWETEAPDITDPALVSAAQEAEIAVMAARLETFQATAADLVSVDDVASVLARITARAGLAVRAQRHLLVVQTTPDAPLLVHHEGFRDGEADVVAAELMAEAPDDRGGSRLIVEVGSARRRYGRLAAIYDEGITFFPSERLQLAAFGRLAAAALDSATALEESRTQAATARALFDFARALANVGTPEDVAERLVAAVPVVVDCDSSVVGLWDDESQMMYIAASAGLSPEAEAVLRTARAGRADSSSLATMLERFEPLFVDQSTDDEFLRNLLARTGRVAAAFVPIAANGELLGVVNAGVHHRPERLRANGELLTRLTSLADIAATALQNARLVEHIKHQALYDPITGLPNKRLLEDRVRTALTQAHRSGEGFTLYFLDLDRFKNVNDTLGHAVGDQLLKQVAHRLLATLREEDTVARLGGDEFAVMLPRIESADVAMVVADKVWAALQQPFLIGNQQLFITSSIGMAIAPLDGDQYDTLLKHADIAMYRAKQQGRNRYASYSPSLHENLSHLLRLESDLHGALASDQLRLFFQPQVRLDDGHLVGAEVLLRWEHPELGMLGPDEFLSIAEETGLIVDIDAWVLREACLQARRWLDAGLTPLRVGVNLSTRDLHDRALIDAVATSLGQTRLEAANLQLEVTERVVGAGSDQVLDTMAKLRGLGVSLAIDDFGTGSSGLSNLRNSPVDTLKIDKTFVHEVTAEQAEVPLLAAMISLARDLGLAVVAEGVETSEQAEFLRRHRCDLAQGYLFGHPMDAGHFTEILRRQS